MSFSHHEGRLRIGALSLSWEELATLRPAHGLDALRSVTCHTGTAGLVAVTDGRQDALSEALATAAAALASDADLATDVAALRAPDTDALRATLMAEVRSQRDHREQRVQFTDPAVAGTSTFTGAEVERRWAAQLRAADRDPGYVGVWEHDDGTLIQPTADQLRAMDQTRTDHGLAVNQAMFHHLATLAQLTTREALKAHDLNREWPT